MWERRASALDPRVMEAAAATHHLNGEKGRRLTVPEIEERVRAGSVPQVRGEFEALQIAKGGGWEIDALMIEMEQKVAASGGKKGLFEVDFKEPRHFTWLLVAFASMGGLLSGLDQSLISGANLYLPVDLGLSVRQNSLVNSGMPLGAVGGALLLAPANEYLGRRMAIIISIVLYTVGAALEAGSINFGMYICSFISIPHGSLLIWRMLGMIVAARVILGIGVGLEGGTVPVYVAETVERRIRGNLVSLYQFNIALGEVFGYVIAAIFLHVKGNWRYILGSSLVFSTIMFCGLVFPGSHCFLPGI